MEIINIVMGDWSDDGHGKTDTVTIETNLTVDEIEEAYKKGTEKVGFDFSKEVARDYEDNQISEDHAEKLNAAGVKVRFADDEENYIYTDEFFTIWLDIVKLGNPEFKYKKIVSRNNEIRIGGYGLFH